MPIAGIPFLFWSLVNDERDAFIFFAFLCLVPTTLGILFAIVALVVSGQIRVRQREQWNPARPYSIAGMVSAAIGMGIAFVIITLITYQIVIRNAMGD